jgi:hypothetical protein
MLAMDDEGARSSRESLKVVLLKLGVYFVAEVADDDFGVLAKERCEIAHCIQSNERS